MSAITLELKHTICLVQDLGTLTGQANRNGDFDISLKTHFMQKHVTERSKIPRLAPRTQNMEENMREMKLN